MKCIDCFFATMMAFY